MTAALKKNAHAHSPLTAQQQAEIAAQRSQTQNTFREVAPELEDLLYQPIPVLDHGFIRVIDYMGTDSAIVQAARVSYGKGTKKVNEDAGLINYLMRHRHTTPFEMCEIKFHIKLPIFIARQWIRHRTANVNEYSGRYSIMDKEFYIPAPEQLAAQSTANRQGRGEVLEGERAQQVLNILKEDSIRCYTNYEEMLNEDIDGNVLDEGKTGLARELARMNLNLNFYTQWYWKVDLHNLLHFLSLRADSHAQYEIRVYAEAMLDVVKAWLPITHAAFMDYRMGGASLSAKGLDVVKRMIAGEQVSQEQSGMSKGEWRELMAVLETQ
ncbi:MAG: FAD-dependent thymidylate synthase [Alphaproteobacteria bacterium]